MSEVTNQEAQQPAPSLSLQDLLLVVQTLQVVIQRGAIRAEEMSTVGGLYDRLVQFLEHSGALKPAGDPAPADQSTADSEETTND